MTEKRRLVMATNNPHKLHEARAIAGDRFEILSLDDIGYHHDIPETADTLEGNALIKARTIRDACGVDCFADDTGLMVEALGGAPGVYTARYAGEHCSPDDNIDLMLKNLEGETHRDAKFATCIALCIDGEEHVFEGVAPGEIATERSGSHGFGYDPVFISKETGKCFAEMSEEDKNAISHRGRAISAMMKWLAGIGICLIACLCTVTADASSWMLHPTYDNQTQQVFDTPRHTYFLARAQAYNAKQSDINKTLNFLYRLDKETDELLPVNAQNLLSSSLILTAGYNAAKGYLLIVYDDFGIDLLYDNGDVHYISALKNATFSSSRNIRSITFDHQRDRAYLSADFGFVAIDDKKHEIVESGLFNTPVDYMVRSGKHLIMQRDGKLYAAPADGVHSTLGDFKEKDWTDSKESVLIFPLDDNKCLLAYKVTDVAHKLLTFNEDSDEPAVTKLGTLYDCTPVENKDGILLVRSSTIYQLDRQGNLSSIKRRDEDRGLPCGTWDFREIHMASPRKGFFSLAYDDGAWSMTRDISRPNSPAAFRVTSMEYIPELGMMVDGHGIDQNFSSVTAQNPTLISGLKNGTWTPYGLPYVDVVQKDRLRNPNGFAIDPDDSNIFYVASLTNGLLRYDITDASKTLHMTKPNDHAEMAGHVDVHPIYEVWKDVSPTHRPRFDTDGNLIAAHNNLDNNPDGGEIWVWTPEKRRRSVSPETFQPFTVLKVGGAKPNMTLLALPLSHASNLGMVVFVALNTYAAPLAIYDHNRTIENLNDDRQTLMSDVYDQDGNKVNYRYLYCATEDPATGTVWVGCDLGVFTLDPSKAFADPTRVNRIKVSRNDGTSLADYLLNGITVNDIAVDNQGRKWFATQGGGLVCTSSDGRNILMELTSENSELPHDNVYTSCYNPENNSMMIATQSGLCEYFLSGQASSASEPSVRAYPNPVRPDYYGWVTIDGLEENCIVKIADSAGNIVRELGPTSGGEAKWDVCNMNLDRVASGVYYVLASSASEGGSFSEVSKILVVN